MRTFVPPLLLLLLGALLAPPALAREPGVVGDFIAALKRTDMKTVASCLSGEMEPDVRTGFLDPRGAAKSGAALERMTFCREVAGPETWRIYALSDRLEYLAFVILREGNRDVIRTLVPLASDRVRTFELKPAGGDPAAVIGIVRGRLSGFRFARSLVEDAGGVVKVRIIGMSDGDLAVNLLSARGEFGLHRIVEKKGRPLPYVKIFGVGERGPDRVDPKPIIGSGMIAEATISWSTLNLPELKLQATAEGTRRLAQFHREMAKPEHEELAFVIDDQIVNHLFPSLGFKTGVFWLQGFYKAEDADLVRSLVSQPPYPVAVKVTETAAE